MGKIRKTHPVKLITGFIFKNDAVADKAKKILEKKFGKIDYESESLPFRYTDYYKAEFGSDLQRKFISFQKLVYPRILPAAKIFTNKIEEKLSENGPRTINIDPGYLDMAKLILASTKDYVHRMYLDKGIFAECTLFYKGTSFTPWEWTYPDYRSSDYIKIFNLIREIYSGQICPQHT